MDYRRRFGHSQRKGGEAMHYITLADLLQYTLVIVAVITLCKKSNR